MELKDVEKLAICLMTEHNLIQSGWKFEFSNAKNEFGHCSCLKKRISISKTLSQINSDDEVKNTILHEIAHALMPINEHHSEKWREKAISIGCNGKRTHNAITPKEKYVYCCPVCSKEVLRHNRIKRTHRLACYDCCKQFSKGRFNKKFVLKLKQINEV
jgi:SprT protein